MGTVKRVVFACVQNAGRSQMAAAFFKQLADPTQALAVSAGTKPAAHVHPEVVRAMREEGLDLSREQPRRLTPELAKDAYLLVTMGCGEECPLVPGLLREDWPLPDPEGLPAEGVRSVRDTIRARVAELIEREGWNPARSSER